MLIKSSGITDVGLKREGNEDSFSVDDSLGLYIVADGMGGHLAGEIASHISVDIINRSYRSWLEEDASSDDIYGGADDSLSREGNYVLGGIRLANRVVYELAYEKKQYQGMGTTVVTLLVTPSMIIAANVGDSRIYMLRDGELEMLSTDHTIVAEQVALGMMTEEEAARSSMKHILTRNLGSSENVEPEIYEIGPSGNDRFVICSDGLTDLVNDEEIRKMMEDANDPEELCRDFIRTVLDRGAHDNTTIVSVFISDLMKSRPGLSGRISCILSDITVGVHKVGKKLIPFK
ncbi:MAG: serine/threonine-protein phosphatase [Deltaproteobacteria bacterium]|nr:serine/threonine-protein phosphatase [Deltaproteobacteria bacterium]